MAIVDVSKGSSDEIASLQQEILSLEKKLSLKKTFEHALQEILPLVALIARAEALPEFSRELGSFFKRARTLLRSRYTNPAFWAALERTARASQVDDTSLSFQRQISLRCS